MAHPPEDRAVAAKDWRRLTAEGNLTAEEARGRASLIHDAEYDIWIDLTSPTSYESISVVRFGCREPGSSSFLDIPGDNSVSVECNGQPMAVDPAAGRASLDDLRDTNTVSVRARLPYSTSGFGLTRYVDAADSRVFVRTQFEPFFAHTVLGCFDQPDLRGRFTIRLRTPNWPVVVSNAPADPNGGKPGETAFLPTQPIPPYLVAVVAGEFHEAVEVVGSSRYRFFCRPSIADELDPGGLAELTHGGLRFFESLLGAPYPYEKYDQAFIPEFSNPGGMEHPGCVTLTDAYVLPPTASSYDRAEQAQMILHEMAHMWFGDLVGIEWWDGLWLKEAMATLLALEALAAAPEMPDPWAMFANGLKNWAYRQDQMPGTHPVVAPLPDVQATLNNFDGITYAKGAAAIRQLSCLLGRERFATVLAALIERRAGGCTDWSDWASEVSRLTGVDLSGWEGEWLRTSGVNELTPVYSLEGGTIASFKVEQGGSPARTHRITIGLYAETGPDAPLARYASATVTISGASTTVPELVGTAEPAVVLLNEDDATYAKVRFDRPSIAGLARGLGRLPSPLCRAVCWSGLWNLTRDAMLASGDFIRVVSLHLDGEEDLVMRRTVAVEAIEALNWLSAGSRQEENAGILAGFFLAASEAAEGGPEQQELVRWFALSALDRGSSEHIHSLLSGSAHIPGLDPDQQMRWAWMRALARTGTIGRDDIRAEQAKDTTERGEREALACVASQPELACKEEAWARIVGTALGPRTRQAVMSAFHQPRQRSVLEPFLERYFAELDRRAGLGSTPSTLQFARGMFPLTATEEGVSARVARFIADHDSDPQMEPVLRLVREGLAEVSLRLRCQAQDQDRSASLLQI